jgi:hypothetical protein
VNGSIWTKRKKTVNRRAFLYGAGGIAIGLPFLEGMPERSAWAQNAQPVFTFFMCAACGVEPKKFWPSGSGDLKSMLSGGKSVDALAPFADNLLIVKGVDFPLTGPTGCGHAQGLAQALTGKSPTGNGGQATSTGPSIDTLISEAVNKSGTSPMTLYAGNLRNGYIADRLSFDKNGQVRASVDNPYKLYTALTSVAQTGGGTTTPPPTTDPGQPTTPTMQDELLSKRKSVNDLVRKELKSLLSSPKLSANDKLRLQQHFDNIRDAEGAIMGMGMNPPTTPTPAAIAGCAMGNIDEATMKGLSSWKYDAKNPEKGGIENIVELHMQLVALAFACDHNRTGTLQWGDGTDHTIYNTPANNSLGNWNLHFISHRTQSDSAVSQNGGAETAHAEIDAIRMKTLARGLQHFKDRGLADKSVIVWTNHVAEGFHSMRNVPFILWGDGGGKLKQNALIDAKSQNGPLLNTIYAAVTGAPSGSFGGGSELAAIKKA